jgi:2-phospho-L-lactate guanylyltransferase
MSAAPKRNELVVVVLQKALSSAKTRLRAVLSRDARTALTLQMLRHVLRVCSSLPSASRLFLCGPDDLAAVAADYQAKMLPGGFAGLRRDAAAAAEDPRIFGHAAMLIVSSDLPLLTVDDLLAVVGAWRACAHVVLGPDRRHRATNVMLVNEPEHFPYSFGEVVGTGSFAAHLSTAVGLNLPCSVIERPGIALDIDLPEDLTCLLRTAPDSPIARFVAAKMQETFRFE